MSHFEATLDAEFDTSFYIYVTLLPSAPPKAGQASSLFTCQSAEEFAC